jgi:hypothetical protein
MEASSMMAKMITTSRRDGNGGHIGAMAMEPIVMHAAILFINNMIICL